VASPGAAAAIDASVASPGPDRSSPHARPVPEAHPTTATTPAGHRPVAPLLARNEALEAEARSLTARLVQELARRNISQADLGFDESVAPLYHRYLVSKRGRDPAAKTESTRLLLASLDGFRMDRQLLARKLTRIAQDVRLLADAAPEAASPLEARLYSAEDKLKSGLGGDPQRQRAFSEELDGLWGEVSRALRAAGRHRSASRAAR
jgi:hypothetical protein